MTLEQIVTQNIAAVIMAALFLGYMVKRDAMMQQIFDVLGEKLGELSKAITSLEKRITNIEKER